jgi:hypothetical protein
MTGRGKIPIHIKNGSRPWSGVTVGQAAEESAPACASAPAAGNEVPMRALKARDAVPRVTPEVLAMVICLGEIATIVLRPRACAIVGTACAIIDIFEFQNIVIMTIRQYDLNRVQTEIESARNEFNAVRSLPHAA